ncbi:MAG: hypothetical protein U5L04_03825 [Trueperaceae bacterium]|nr:hypothetical protein [Trueperaceae bacterium]
MEHPLRSTPHTRPVSLPTYRPIAEQPRGFDLLRIPGLRRLIRWKYARFLFQLPLLILAVFVIWDGLTGRQLAPRNVATTSVWLHYRGLVVVALALVGNAFCAACPLMLTRGVSRRLERLLPSKLSWPRGLKNKYLVTVLLVGFFFSYEYFDLWASPWLTAWLAIGYFGAALAIDTLFPVGTFCRYVCPLGNFNFAFASGSPTQITAANHDLCRSCEHKPCLHGRETYTDKLLPSTSPIRPSPSGAAFIPLSDITNPNGQGYFPGCETDLFVPTMQSNMDCTSCFNCVRACPYDNVALTVRPPTWEWTRGPWAKRGKLAVIIMGVLLTFYGLLNAVAMIGPYFSLAEGVAHLLGTRQELPVLALFFVLTAVIGLGVTTLVSWLADLAGGKRDGPWRALQRWGYVIVALGFGFWGAHYLFHFLTGALSIVPVFEHFFSYRGFDVDPNWRLSQMVPSAWLFPITAGITTFYAMLAAYVTVRIALRDFGRNGVIAMWPMLLFVLAFAALSLVILAQPMEMRGTIFGPSF